MQILNLVVTGTILAFSGTLLADNSRLRCDEKQSFCVVNNKRLITGDSVLFINDSSEIVAKGEVGEMRGTSRKVDIKNKYAVITDDVRVLNADQHDYSSYRVARMSAPYQVGANLNLSKYNVAADAMGYGLDVVAMYNWQHGIILTGRVQGFTVSGIVDKAEASAPSVDYSLNGILVLAGAAYTFFPKNAVAFRPSLEVGSGYTSISTNGAAYVSSLDRVGDGFAAAGRVGLDAVYTRLGEWSPAVSVSFGMINRGIVTSLGLGLTKEIN